MSVLMWVSLKPLFLRNSSTESGSLGDFRDLSLVESLKALSLENPHLSTRESTMKWSWGRGFSAIAVETERRVLKLVRFLLAVLLPKKRQCRETEEYIDTIF